MQTYDIIDEVVPFGPAEFDEAVSYFRDRDTVMRLVASGAPPHSWPAPWGAGKSV